MPTEIPTHTHPVRCEQCGAMTWAYAEEPCPVGGYRCRPGCFRTIRDGHAELMKRILRLYEITGADPTLDPRDSES